MTDDGKVREVPFAARAEARREVLAEIAAVNWLLAHFAAELPPESPTAKAVGRGAGWREIEALARWEEVGTIIGLLDEARRALGDELPAEMTARLDRSMEASRLGKNTLPPAREGAQPPPGVDDPSGD